jgi:hypothetical protein
MRLTFAELAESFHYKGLELVKCKKGYDVLVNSEYIRFSNLTEASEWLSLLNKEETPSDLASVESKIEEIQQTTISENQETLEQENMQDSPNIQTESIYQQIHDNSKKLDTPEQSTEQNLITDFEPTAKINPLVIEFSRIKKAVNFFSQFREKNQNTIKIDNQGFYYLDNWYSVYIDIENEIILNFDNLKDFVDIFPGSDDSKILLDVENSLIKNGNFQHSIAIKTATETYENYSISDFNYLTQIKSDTLSKVLSAASLNKREKELQVLNFKFTDTNLKVACTNSSQIFGYNLKVNFDSLRNIDLQISSDIAKKFSKLTTHIDILHFDNVICIVADDLYKFIIPEEREFFDYTSFLFENIDISWHTKFLNPLFQFLKKLKQREDYTVRFTNQGNNCLFEIVSNQGVVYSGKFLQKDCNFNEFSVTADLFYNLLANIQEFSRLTISLNDGYLVAKVLDSRYDFILNLMD